MFKKLFCKHKWNTHSKKQYNWTETQIIKGTENWYYPKLEPQSMEETQEVLICEKCGKIHKLIY